MDLTGNSRILEVPQGASEACTVTVVCLDAHTLMTVMPDCLTGYRGGLRG